jgi:hypothetical protein
MMRLLRPQEASTGFIKGLTVAMNNSSSNKNAGQEKHCGTLRLCSRARPDYQTGPEGNAPFLAWSPSLSTVAGAPSLLLSVSRVDFWLPLQQGPPYQA